jgi:hypothetical protein
MRGSCDGRSVGMLGEATMAKPGYSVVTAVMVGTHKAQEGASSGVQFSHSQ